MGLELREGGGSVLLVAGFPDFHSLGWQGLLLQSHMKSVMVSAWILLMNTSPNSALKSPNSVLGLFGGVDFGE